MNAAYLIVICDRVDNHILEVCIWSSPEWMQSQLLPHPTYVAYMVSSSIAYAAAGKLLLDTISHPYSRYRWLYEKLTEEQKEGYGFVERRKPE